MNVICDGCKKSVNQSIPHGKPVNMAWYGCTKKQGHCSAYQICDYFIEVLKEYDLLKVPHNEEDYLLDLLDKMQ